LVFSIEMNAVNQIPVLQKAIQVISAIGNCPRENTTTTLARLLKIAPATCYRIIQTFSRNGWVRVLEDGKCELGNGLFVILNQLQSHDLMGTRVTEALKEITAVSGVTSKVSVRDADEAVTLLRVDSMDPMGLSVRPGSRFHLTLGASGSVLMAGLADKEVDRIINEAPGECWQYQTPEDVRRRIMEVRAQGTVYDSGKYRPDIFGISAPLYDAEGKLHAALTITGLKHGRLKKQIEEWRQLLARKTAVLNKGRN
jgi:DNA-binding IclR family transcriptional regulator